MTTKCEECGKITAHRSEFEKWHTCWECRSCGCTFTYSLRGTFITRHGSTYTQDSVPADQRIHGPIGDAYAAYDSDSRVNGPDDFEAFADAVEVLLGN